MYLTPENPWVFIDKTNADDFLKEVLKLGKPTEVSIVGAFGKEGRGSTQDMDLPLHFDGEYSARKAAEKGLTFDKKIDILYLDGWDKGTPNFAENHLEAYKAAKDKLSNVHLILIDDTDFNTADGGKDRLLSPYLIENGYSLLFNGRQTLFLYRI